MPKTLTQRRAEAAARGLAFMYRMACDPECFEAYGYDQLFCFYTIAANSKDASLRSAARRMGRERARVWRRENPSVSKGIRAHELSALVLGSDAADRLGVRDERFKSQIRSALQEFTVEDFYGFDPEREPPPDDVSDVCECGAAKRRGRKRCGSCRRALVILGRYGAWLDAIIMSYMGERYGVKVGARLRDVIKWLPQMRPYRGDEGGRNPDFYWTVYAITHVVYALNHYNLYRLSPEWLPQEFEFLKANLDEAINYKDPEMMGEFLDTLKAFGLADSHPLIRRGTVYLLSEQNEEGGWCETKGDDLYMRYHPTFTAVNGLRDIAWRGQRLSFPRLKPLIEGVVSSQ